MACCWLLAQLGRYNSDTLDIQIFCFVNKYIHFQYIKFLLLFLKILFNNRGWIFFKSLLKFTACQNFLASFIDRKYHLFLHIQQYQIVFWTTRVFEFDMLSFTISRRKQNERKNDHYIFFVVESKHSEAYEENVKNASSLFSVQLSFFRPARTRNKILYFFIRRFQTFNRLNNF